MSPVIFPCLTALGPRRPRASRASLTNGKRRGDLQPPLLVAPILPPLPEMNAFAPEQPWPSMAPGQPHGYPGPGELPVLFGGSQPPSPGGSQGVVRLQVRQVRQVRCFGSVPLDSVFEKLPENMSGTPCISISAAASALPSKIGVCLGFGLS